MARLERCFFLCVCHVVINATINELFAHMHLWIPLFEPAETLRTRARTSLVLEILT
jgi:hypothetical protein